MQSAGLEGSHSFCQHVLQRFQLEANTLQAPFAWNFWTNWGEEEKKARDRGKTQTKIWSAWWFHTAQDSWATQLSQMLQLFGMQSDIATGLRSWKIPSRTWVMFRLEYSLIEIHRLQDLLIELDCYRSSFASCVGRRWLSSVPRVSSRLLVGIRDSRNVVEEAAGWFGCDSVLLSLYFYDDPLEYRSVRHLWTPDTVMLVWWNLIWYVQ